jgi:hypothetical protein
MFILIRISKNDFRSPQLVSKKKDGETIAKLIYQLNKKENE